MTRRYVELWRRVRSGLWSPHQKRFEPDQSIGSRQSIDGDAACTDHRTSPSDYSYDKVKQSRHLRAVLVTDLSVTDAALTFRIRDRTSGRPVLNRANTQPVMGICLFVDRYWIGTRTSR